MFKRLENLKKEPIKRIKIKFLLMFGYSMTCPCCGNLAKESNGIVFEANLNERKGIGICNKCLGNLSTLDENKIVKNIENNLTVFHLKEDDLIKIACAITNYKKGFKLVAVLA